MGIRFLLALTLNTAPQRFQAHCLGLLARLFVAPRSQISVPICFLGTPRSGPKYPAHWASYFCGAVLSAALLPCLAEEANESKVVLRIYDVRDFTSTLTDFPAPRDRDSYLPGSPGQNPFFDSGPTRGRLAPQDLADLIQQRILPQDFQDPATSIQESGGKLVIMNTPVAQAKVHRVLEELRAKVTRRASIQALEIAVPPAQALKWPNDLGRIASMNQIKDLLDEKVGGKLISAPSLVLFDGQTGHLMSGRAESGSDSSEATRTGVVLQAMPILGLEDGKIRLLLRFFHATPKGAPREVRFEAVRFEGDRRNRQRSSEVKGGVNEDGKELRDTKVEESDVTTSVKTAVAVVSRKRVEQDRWIRSVDQEMTLNSGSWTLVSILDPQPGTAEGTTEAHAVLLFVRCDELADYPNAK